MHFSSCNYFFSQPHKALRKVTAVSEMFGYTLSCMCLRPARACWPLDLLLKFVSPFSMLHCCKTERIWYSPWLHYIKTNTQNHTNKSCPYMGTITCGPIFHLHNTSSISGWCRGPIIQLKWYQNFAVFLTLIASWVKCFSIWLQEWQPLVACYFCDTLRTCSCYLLMQEEIACALNVCIFARWEV